MTYGGPADRRCMPTGGVEPGSGRVEQESTSGSRSHPFRVTIILLPGRSVGCRAVSLAPTGSGPLSGRGGSPSGAAPGTPGRPCRAALIVLTRLRPHFLSAAKWCLLAFPLEAASPGGAGAGWPGPVPPRAGCRPERLSPTSFDDTFLR